MSSGSPSNKELLLAGQAAGSPRVTPMICQRAGPAAEFRVVRRGVFLQGAVLPQTELEMAVKLDDERREILASRLRGFYSEEFDEDLSAFRAEKVLDFFLEALGPAVYNQAVQDARGFMQRKLDDLDGEVYEAESF
jgi:uncharacterized protein (DUF2164 family)